MISTYNVVYEIQALLPTGFLGVLTGDNFCVVSEIVDPLFVKRDHRVEHHTPDHVVRHVSLVVLGQLFV